MRDYLRAGQNPSSRRLESGFGRIGVIFCRALGHRDSIGVFGCLSKIASSRRSDEWRAIPQTAVSFGQKRARRVPLHGGHCFLSYPKFPR